MSDRALTALSWVVPAVLAIVGAYFALIYDPRPEAEQGSVGLAVEQAGAVGEAAGVVDIVRQLRRGKEVREARAVERAHAEREGPRRRDLRRLERQRASAVPVGRRFFAAFARYELGLLRPAIAAELRETATTRFAGELLAAPPRLPEDRERPAMSELGGLEFVVGATRGGRMRTAELFGWVDRAGTRSPFAIELERRAGGWLVAGIGR